jgi:hypothetical protein
METIHLSVRAVRATQATGAASLYGLIGYIAGLQHLGGQTVFSPHSLEEIAHFDTLGFQSTELVEFVRKLDNAEKKKHGGGYQMRGGRHADVTLPDGKILKAKKSCGPVLARHIDVALPYGIPVAERIQITKEFAAFLHARFGVAVIFGVHNKAGMVASDAHFILSERYIDAAGTPTKKNRELNGVASARRAKRANTTAADSAVSACEEMRVEFTRLCNARLAPGSSELQHKSYERRGVDRVAQPKRNRTRERLKARAGVKSYQRPSRLTRGRFPSFS